MRILEPTFFKGRKPTNKDSLAFIPPIACVSCDDVRKAPLLSPLVAT